MTNREALMKKMEKMTDVELLQFFQKISQLISERDLQRNLTSTFKTEYTMERQKEKLY